MTHAVDWCPGKYQQISVRRERVATENSFFIGQRFRIYRKYGTASVFPKIYTDSLLLVTVKHLSCCHGIAASRCSNRRYSGWGRGVSVGGFNLLYNEVSDIKRSISCAQHAVRNSVSPVCVVSRSPCTAEKQLYSVEVACCVVYRWFFASSWTYHLLGRCQRIGIQ